MEQIQTPQSICIIVHIEEANVPLLNRRYFSFFERVRWQWRADNPRLGTLSPCAVT